MSSSLDVSWGSFLFTATPLPGECGRLTGRLATSAFCQPLQVFCTASPPTSIRHLSPHSGRSIAKRSSGVGKGSAGDSGLVPNYEFNISAISAALLLAPGWVTAGRRHQRSAQPPPPPQENATRGWPVSPRLTPITLRSEIRQGDLCSFLGKHAARFQNGELFSAKQTGSVFQLSWRTKRMSTLIHSILTFHVSDMGNTVGVFSSG